MSNRHEKDKGVNVQVILRCRPFSNDELRNNAPQVVTCNDYQREVAVSQNVAGKHIDRVFTFDKVFGPSSQQKDLYNQAIIPIVKEVLEGFNCTIFAYGQTGTGKTYTMEGDCKRSKTSPDGTQPAGAGVIPRAIKQIFDTLESQNAEYSVKVTFLELYNEEITDLLAPEEISRVALEDKQKKQLPLMEDGKGGVLVRGLEEEIVSSASEIFALLERGSAKRRTAETLLNKQSSRSHSLFSITIHIKETTPEGEELIKCGKLNLVDLAGSENISRSGAREGRAREAGEINKSLLTLGRVISALVEHLGHVPYRDSKLTRLLRDSLGGRTKTCIIATVSPAVHCLEETLSTLDYAHRAKHIRNKPEVNQKMMKSTLIKDLYGEIERLKTEIYAAREKSGVYIPKDRYYQEESERKAMADQIEQMGVTVETHQKDIEELQGRYDSKVQECSELSRMLESAQKDLSLTSKSLMDSKEELKRCKYTLKEKDFIISEQKKAENALAHQACILQSNLEKVLQDNASLYSKIDREDKLNADNKSVVVSYQAELAKQLGSLSSTMAASISQQDEHLQFINQMCHSLLNAHNEAVAKLKKKVMGAKTSYVSHVEALQNVVRFHKASADASLEDMSSLASHGACSIEEFLAAADSESMSIYDDLQATLSRHQGEMALFARELRQRFHDSSEHMKDISKFIHGYLHKITEQVDKLGDHASQAEGIQSKSISEFQKAFEEQTKTGSEKLIADITDLVTKHIYHQKEMVDATLVSFKETASANKSYLNQHVSLIECITKDAKRKWEAFSMQAESNANDTADYSAAQHCSMELLFHKSMSAAQTASKNLKRTHESVNEKCAAHASGMVSVIRDLSESNREHDSEVDSARTVAEQDARECNDIIMQELDRISEWQQGEVSGIFSSVKAQADDLKVFREGHSDQAACIQNEAEATFQHRYMDYEPIGTTPTRCEAEVPSKASIESLCTVPINTLLEEFRENHPYDLAAEKAPRPSLPSRSPLAELN